MEEASQRYAFASFSGKGRIYTADHVSGDKPQIPLVRLTEFRVLAHEGASQSYAFCFFFWKKKNITHLIKFVVEAMLYDLLVREDYMG
jgi:hypothetical protein